MAAVDDGTPPALMGGWQDAEALRRWSFQRRSPQQRLDWLVAVLTLRSTVAQQRASPETDGRDAGRAS